MRYDDLTVPVGNTTLHVDFHPRLTVLADMSGTQRKHFLDVVAQLHRGALPGGRVSLTDSRSRTRVVDDLAGDDTAQPAERSIGAWRNLLTVTSEDLGLPRASDDPGRLALRNELDATRRKAAKVRAALDDAHLQRRHHEAALAALDSCDTQLSKLGTATDRHLRMRARTLVEVEQLRATLDAIDAPAVQVQRDRRLIAATNAIEDLAEEWARTGESRDRLDHLLGDQARVDPEDLASLIDVPDEIPESLTAAMAARDRLRASRDDAKHAVRQANESSGISLPSDSRVLTLAMIDQEALWLSHRDVLLATEALHAAQQTEAERPKPDGGEHAQIEEAHQRVLDATHVVERRWLPTVLGATVLACAAALLLITNLWLFLVPVLTVTAAALLVAGVLLPRVRMRRAIGAEAAELERVGSATVSEYRARLTERPGSERWQRAEAAIADFTTAQEEWHAIVGEITPEEATELEDTVHEWVAQTDRGRRDRETTRLRREIEQLSLQITDATRRLQVLLEPYGIDAHETGLAAALQERVLRGRTARMQVALGETEEVERKITHRLETELADLGFEAGSLANRISFYGRELDAARERDRLRMDNPDRSAVVSRGARLQALLDSPVPVEPPTTRGGTDPSDPTIVALRKRHEELSRQVATYQEPHLHELERRLRRLTAHIDGIETSLTTEHGLVVSDPVGHLVETLVRYRPTWPTTEQEPAPAFLDDPFAATSAELKRHLLEALIEVGQVVQVILLTSDPDVAVWAREAAQRGELALVAPIRSAA